MTDTLRDKLINKGWVTSFNADTLVRLIEQHYAERIKPVPVSERLPEPEDCDAEGRCWVWWKNGVRWVLDEWTHHELREGRLSDCVSYWLPARALPLPGQEVEE